MIIITQKFLCSLNIPLESQKLQVTLTIITHTTLLSLCLTIRNTFPIFTLPFFQTGSFVHHWRTFWAFSRCSGTFGFLLASCILCFSAFNPCHHKLAMLTTRCVFIAAYSSLIAPQLAIFVATRIIVINQSSITLFVTFYS